MEKKFQTQFNELEALGHCFSLYYGKFILILLRLSISSLSWAWWSTWEDQRFKGMGKGNGRFWFSHSNSAAQAGKRAERTPRERREEWERKGSAVSKKEVTSFSWEGSSTTQARWLLLCHFQGLASEGVLGGRASSASNKKTQMKALVVGQALRWHMAIKC